MAQTFFRVYYSYLEAIEPLGDAERGRLFTACLQYSMTGEEPELPGNERFTWPSIRFRIDRDEKRCVVSRGNGALGGRARAAGKTKAACGESRQTEANASEPKQSEANADESKRRLPEKEKEKEREKENTKDTENALSERKEPAALADGVREPMDWVKERRRKPCAPMTDYAVSPTLQELSGGDEQKTAAMPAQSAERGWKGVFAPGRNTRGKAPPRGGKPPIERRSYNDEQLSQLLIGLENLPGQAFSGKPRTRN